MKTIEVEWTGIRPLVMHNGDLVDPKNRFTKEAKAIRKQKGWAENEALSARMEALDWEGGLYWSEEHGPVIPSDNIERCIQLGAQKTKNGKATQAAVLCTVPEVKLEYSGPRDKAKLFADPRFTLRRGVVIQRSRMIKVRPMFPTGWRLAFTLEYDETLIKSKADLVKAMQDAGALVGLGDWRPKFGRFTVETA